MPDKEAEKLEVAAIRGYAAHLRNQLAQGSTESSFTVS